MQRTIAAALSMKLNTHLVKAGDSFQTRVCHAAVMVPVRTVHEWHAVVAECRNLLAEQEIPSRSLRCGRALPVDYENAAACLDILIINLLFSRTRNLMIAIQESPASEDYFVYSEEGTPDAVMCKLKNDSDAAEMFREDPLFWCLLQMTGPPEGAMKMDPAVVFALFDDIVAEKSAAGRVDSRLLDRISDLAALWEILRAIRLDRPLPRKMDITEALSIRSGGIWEESRLGRKYGNALGAKRFDDVYSAVSANMPPLMSAKIPSGRRDEHWLQKTAKSHAALRELWKGFRDSQGLLLRYAGFSEELIDEHMATISFDKSKGYQEALQAERVRIIERQQNLLFPVANEGAMRLLSSNVEAQTGRGYPVQGKTKVKTRAADQVNEEDDEKPTPEEQVTAKTTITVKVETLQIFHRMFPSFDDDNELSSSMIDWRKFVIAMADAGFACRHGTGSAVTFNHKDGRIVIHKPHPVAKLDFRSLLKIGKRLNKWFGFERDTFEVA